MCPRPQCVHACTVVTWATVLGGYCVHNVSVYTNSVAKISLDFASQVATLLGLTPPPEWQQLSDALVILFNGTIHPEYAGYNGETIKQADVILLGFPLDIDFGHMSPAVRKADLDYYGSVTSPGGPGGCIGCAPQIVLRCVAWLLSP